MRAGESGGGVVGGELLGFYENYGSALASSWEPLCEAAQMGFGNRCTDPEARLLLGGITDDDLDGKPRRMGRFDLQRGAIQRDRRVLAALHALPVRAPGLPPWSLVLFAAFGPIPWERRIDQGAHANDRVRALQRTRKLGRLYGVMVLLAALDEQPAAPPPRGALVRVEHPQGERLDAYRPTTGAPASRERSAVLDGIREDRRRARLSLANRERERPRLALTGAEQHVIDLCLDTSIDGQAALRHAREEAQRLLDDAEGHYRRATGRPPREAAPRTERRPRQRTSVPLAMGAGR